MKQHRGYVCPEDMPTSSWEFGFSILTVIFTMVVLAVLGTASVSLLTRSAEMAANEYHTQQAFNVAQAGVIYMTKQLEGDSDWSDNIGVDKNFIPGQFTVTFLEQTANTATIRSDGTVQGVTRSVTQELSLDQNPEAFKHALYNQDNIGIYDNSNVTINGSITTEGNVSQSGNGSMNLNGDVTENHAEAEIPTPDWAYWQGIADHVYAGNYNFPGDTHTGIYYIGGIATIDGRSDFVLNGTIIVRNRITISGNGNVTITAQGTNPAIVAEKQISISTNENVTINGWILSQHYVSMSDNSNVTSVGGIVSYNNMTITTNSNFTITYDENIVPDDGFIGGEGTEGIVSGTWREVY